MAFTKFTYTDNVSIIGAENLNGIQDELIRVANAVDSGSGSGSTAAKVIELETLSNSTAPTYIEIHNAATLIKYGNNFYGFIGEKFDGATYVISYQCEQISGSNLTAPANILYFAYQGSTLACIGCGEVASYQSRTFPLTSLTTTNMPTKKIAEENTLVIRYGGRYYRLASYQTGLAGEGASGEDVNRYTYTCIDASKIYWLKFDYMSDGTANQVTEGSNTY